MSHAEIERIIAHIKSEGFGIGWFLLIVIFCHNCSGKNIPYDQMKEIKEIKESCSKQVVK